MAAQTAHQDDPGLYVDFRAAALADPSAARLLFFISFRECALARPSARTRAHHSARAPRTDISGRTNTHMPTPPETAPPQPLQLPVPAPCTSSCVDQTPASSRLSLRPFSPTKPRIETEAPHQQSISGRRVNLHGFPPCPCTMARAISAQGRWGRPAGGTDTQVRSCSAHLLARAHG